MYKIKIDLISKFLNSTFFNFNLTPIYNFLSYFYQVCGEQEEIERAMELLPKALETTSIVFSRMETLYAIHDLHQLP